MRKVGLNQEMLKLIACVTMLIDHIGAVLIPESIGLRIIGRIAFPIYCFLLAEGVHYTRDPKKYGLRLVIGAILSEIPFDLAIFGGVSWGHQSVMVTLLVGFVMAICMNRVEGFRKIAVMIPFVLAAEWMMTDYGGLGVVFIGIFVLTRGTEKAWKSQTLGMALVSLAGIFFGMFSITEIFCLFAMIPISLYNGTKNTHAKTIQWGFYLFYPLHLLVLWVISVKLM